MRGGDLRALVVLERFAKIFYVDTRSARNSAAGSGVTGAGGDGRAAARGAMRSAHRAGSRGSRGGCEVLCSVKRGAVMRTHEQTPGSKGRWFAVAWGKDSSGWVHENFVRAIR